MNVQDGLIRSSDTTGPLFSKNPLKLGVFGLNSSSTGAITKAPDRHEIGWQQNLRLVQEAEAAGFEAAFSHARWRGLEGASNPWGNSFEGNTWASALAAATDRISLVATVHMPTMSPVLAAKQITTIDHVSNGRAAINVVAGWSEKELSMFGMGRLTHDERYAYGAEWMDILHRLWESKEDFDFHGKYLHIENGYQAPKNIQTPRPPIINAGFSPTGHEFAAQWADLAFVAPSPDRGEILQQVAALKQRASDRGRSLQVWVAATVVASETDESAAMTVGRYEDQADGEAIGNLLDWMGGGGKIPEERRHGLAKHLSAYAGGYPLVGSYSTVAEQIAGLSKAGIDGLCLAWMNYEKGLPEFIANVLPKLRQLGLRGFD